MAHLCLYTVIVTFLGCISESSINKLARKSCHDHFKLIFHYELGQIMLFRNVRKSYMVNLLIMVYEISSRSN